MPSSRSRSRSRKKKKEKKSKGKLRKFDTALFGLLTFTRYYGKEWENFMYTPEKRNKARKKPKVKPRRGKKPTKKGKKKKVDIPKLPKFPPVPEPRTKAKEKPLPITLETPKVILPIGTHGYKHRTTRKERPLTQAGSVRDVMCGPKYPLPPRPLPHGGVFGDQTCPGCTAKDHLLETNYAILHKKMKTIIHNHFDKAKYVLEYLIEHAHKAMEYYKKHIEKIMEELEPVFDAMDESEWNEHQEVRKLKDKWRQKRNEWDDLRKELKRLRNNRDEEIRKAIEQKQREVNEAEQNLLDLEKQLEEALAELHEWKTDPKGKLQRPADEIARRLAYLRAIQKSIIRERDNLRSLLDWETKIATQKTVDEMERIIAQDIDHVLSYMNPSWFKLIIESRKLKQELESVEAENHLLALEVDTLTRQCEKIEAKKQHLERIKTLSIRPLGLPTLVQRYLNACSLLQIYEYPVTNLIHE